MSVLANLVDEFGELKAQISKLCEREKELKELFIQSNMPEIDGSMFRVTVSTSERETLDVNAAKQFLTHDQIQLCTKITYTTTVRCGSRKK